MNAETPPSSTDGAHGDASADDCATTALPARSDEATAATRQAETTHVYNNRVVCATDARGHATPDDRSPTELVVDATEGFIPLWAPGVTLRWRFQAESLMLFVDPQAAAEYLRELFGQALQLWGDARPVRFTEASDAWDFEIAVNPDERCNPNGCTLASAFFPDGGQHELRIYPTMFEQPREEQIETMAHEIGHVFGLRHFFAQIQEQRWASEIFGDHQPFSIMNYGPNSVMTETDRSDLIRLYTLAWSGELTQINGTPIRLMQPFSAARPPSSPCGPGCVPAPYPATASYPTATATAPGVITA